MCKLSFGAKKLHWYFLDRWVTPESIFHCASKSKSGAGFMFLFGGFF